jgi:hypothetical protein
MNRRATRSLNPDVFLERGRCARGAQLLLNTMPEHREAISRLYTAPGRVPPRAISRARCRVASRNSVDRECPVRKSAKRFPCSYHPFALELKSMKSSHLDLAVLLGSFTLILLLVILWAAFDNSGN